MDKLITINLSYYNQDAKVLKEHINAWSTFDKPIRDRFSFFIMDDGSKIPVMKLLETIDYSKIDLHVYRVNVDLFCNIAGVRNLSAQECKSPYMIICDMDTLICNNAAKQMLELAENNKTKNTQKKSNSSVYTLDEAAEILGVRVDSSADEIELAYRKLMKKIHPDNGGSNYLAVKVNAAHDLLMNKFRNK